jgi:hypothetical protein
MTEFAPIRKRLLTRPVLKWVVDVPTYIKIETAMHIGKEMKEKAGEKKKEPATLCNVIDLRTGALAQIIVNAVLKSVLAEDYPNDSYVGLCFAVTKQSRQPGKQYDPFYIEEIEDPNATVQTAAASTPISAAKRR